MGDNCEPQSGFVWESTQDVRRQDRVEYWRSLHPSVSLDVPSGSDHRAFEGERLHCRTGNGGAVCYARAADTFGHFEGASPDFLLLSFVMAGAAELRSERGTDVIASPGAGALLVDSGATIRSRSHDCAHAYLTLPKRLVGLDPVALTGDDGIRLLPEAGLLRFLRLHLQEIAAGGNELSPAAASVAAENALQLAVAALGEPEARHRKAPEDRELFEAAKAMIELRIADVDLTASTLAQALGCSRTLLYRVFSDRDRGVGEMIRAARIARAKSLLATDETAPIKVIARMSGYENAAAFSRAFRRHEGVSPNRYRSSVH